MRSQSSDVLVVGAGAIGLAISWRLAAAGREVTLVDPAPCSGASHVAAGMLAPVGEVQYGEEPKLRLALESVRRYPGFVAELLAASGEPVGYLQCGTLMVARDADDHAALDELFAFRRELGLDAERVSSQQCRELEPTLSPRIRSGILLAGDHQVDPRALTAALLVACDRNGVRLVRDRASSLRTASDRVAGVQLAGGERLDAPVVVLAAGSWSGELAGVPAAVRPPVRPVKGQLLVLRGPAGAPLVRHVIRGIDAYLVPRGDGRVILGGTVEERGFDTTATAGAVRGLLRDGWELVPGVDELELLEVVVGLRPGTPDNAPLLGPTAVTGLILATGHFRNGIELTPITADLIAELVTTGAVPERLKDFLPDRFAGPAGTN